MGEEARMEGHLRGGMGNVVQWKLPKIYKIHEPPNNGGHGVGVMIHFLVTKQSLQYGTGSYPIESLAKGSMEIPKQPRLLTRQQVALHKPI